MQRPFSPNKIINGKYHNMSEGQNNSLLNGTKFDINYKKRKYIKCISFKINKKDDRAKKLYLFKYRIVFNFAPIKNKKCKATKYTY